ncbi:hypothetical protein A2Z00_02185, partial [Candidatus Gottesmanbacteria bacterium RBG_13_45_10]
ALFPFLGNPLISYAIRSAITKGTSRLVVVTNEKNNQSIQSMQVPIKLTTVIQKSFHGMADAVLSCASEIGNSSLVLVNADDAFDSTLVTDVVQKGDTTEAFGILPGWKTEQYLPLGYLAIEGETIRRIEEKPPEGKQPSQYITLVCHYIRDSDRLISEIKKTQSENDDVYEKALSSLMQSQSFLMMPYKGDFASLKYPWHVLDVLDFLLKRIGEYRGKHVEVKSNVTIEGPVYIEDNVTICENTKIVGPCYIGKNTIIGNNNIIRASHIGADCITGFNTDITRSYVGDACWFHTNYIGDSVLEGNISMGSGGVLANLRLDEKDIYSMVKGERVNTRRNKLGAMIGKNVRIGVNTSIMPGVKIGSGSFIGSGIVLDKDVSENSFCTLRDENYVVTSNATSMNEETREEFKKRL